MAGIISLMIVQCHSRGEEWKKKWNKEWGDENREGVINPAVLEIERYKRKYEKRKNENWEKRLEKLVDNWEEIDWIDIKVFICQLLKSEKTKNYQKFVDALIWCSGSEDFQVGGKARKGWEKICLPLLRNKK